MKRTTALLCFVLSAAFAWSLPKVDGQVSAGEYGRSVSVLYGSATLYYQSDGEGGLYLAVSARTAGWVGLGLGSGVMNGARIFMGYVKDGTPVFSEQIGEGHGHSEAPDRAADAYAVGQAGGLTTIEFHLRRDKLPLAGSNLNYIVAFAGAPDLATYHEDNREGGVIDLSAP